ncbi:MAG TPA: hypothetical protein VEA80_05925 [Vitreimonas sp.]|uniref:hypothetical protein n=1 Tax=Vitreimonas sp. TaxID=3069702 RepID=UPI002D44F579|nr:hypothetical protein [Vitreimonas sp.]HYD86990.1 hypothetical protein [Vitreimonas sp.]
MIRILVALIVLGLAAFFTNPKPEAYETKARETLQAAAQEDLENLDVGGVIGNSAAQLGEGEYENFFVASRYSMPSAADARVQCYGAFTLVNCSPTARS